jgi:hypothetical protein
MWLAALLTITCQFQPINDSYQGGCGTLFGENRTLMITPARTITTGVWRKDAAPTAVWFGDMTDTGSPNYPIEIELYSGGSGIMRTEFGWYAVAGFTASPTVRFQLDTILSSPSAWNRADNRKCAPTATGTTIIG